MDSGEENRVVSYATLIKPAQNEELDSLSVAQLELLRRDLVELRAELNASRHAVRAALPRGRRYPVGTARQEVRRCRETLAIVYANQQLVSATLRARKQAGREARRAALEGRLAGVVLSPRSLSAARFAVERARAVLADAEVHYARLLAASAPQAGGRLTQQRWDRVFARIDAASTYSAQYEATLSAIRYERGTSHPDVALLGELRARAEKLRPMRRAASKAGPTVAEVFSEKDPAI